MILKRLYTACGKIKLTSDELVLNRADAQAIKKALEKIIFAVPVKKIRPIKKKKIRPEPEDPFRNIIPEESPEFDKWIDREPHGYTPGIDAKPRHRPGGHKQRGKKDKMVTAKNDMINHIQALIDDGQMSPDEYLAEPNIYLDSQIVGKYINNPIIKRSIIIHFKRKYQL